MPQAPREGRDLRAYARSTQLRLVLGALLILTIVGNGLIWLIYGSQAVRLSLLCMGLGLAPTVLIVLFLGLVTWIVRKAEDD